MTAFLLDDIRNGNAAADRLLTHLAAGGDLTAQRDLLTLMVGDPARSEDRQLSNLTFEEAVRAELLARFCALRGDAFDVRRLAGVLHQMAATAAAPDDRLAFACESAELLRGLADEGDGVASELIARLVDEFPGVRPVLAVSDTATPASDPPPPPPIIATNVTGEPTLGDLLAEALTQQPPPRGFVQRVRDYLSDLAWRVRFRLSA